MGHIYYFQTTQNLHNTNFNVLSPPQSNPYGLKDSGATSDMTAWTSAGLQPTSSYYPYDHSLAAYG